MMLYVWCKDERIVIFRHDSLDDFGLVENTWGFFHVLYVCTSPRHEDMIARIPPVCATLRLVMHNSASERYIHEGHENPSIHSLAAADTYLPYSLIPTFFLLIQKISQSTCKEPFAVLYLYILQRVSKRFTSLEKISYLLIPRFAIIIPSLAIFVPKLEIFIPRLGMSHTYSLSDQVF